MTDTSKDLSTLTFHGVLAELVAERAQSLAVIDDIGEHTWAEINDEATQIAKAMLASGVQAGDRVAALMRNRAKFLATLLGVSRTGAVFVPLNTWYSQSELRWTLQHTEACTLLSESEFLGHIWAQEIASIEPAITSAEPGRINGHELPALRLLTYTDGDHCGAHTWADFLALGQAVTDADLAIRAGQVEGGDPALILYTSGSTSQPKGVVLSHASVLANGIDNGERRGIGVDDLLWLGSPLFYGLGAANVVPMIMVRRSTLVLQDRFDPEQAMAVIEKYRCNVFYGTSNMIRRIYESPGYDLARIASLEKGSAGIERVERELLMTEMGVSGACTAYGATELSGMCFVSNPDDSLELKLDYSGYPLPGFEAVIVDPDTLKPVPAGQLGLLKIRGHIALSYYKDPERTAEAFDDEGFYWTGDLGSLNEDGYFRWHGRVKEMIKSGGINVSPTEVEALLLEHEAISEAYVVGVPDRVQGEVAAAFIVALSGLDIDELRADLRSRAASFKVPAHILLRRPEEIPRTTSGKAAKRDLRDQWDAVHGTTDSEGAT